MEKLGEIVKPIIRVKVKTWDEMVEQYGWYREGTINLEQFGWHKELEKLIPEDRIIEVIEKYKPKEYYMIDYLYGISQNAVAKIMEEESCKKASLDNPEHPANQELLPELDAFNLEEQEHIKSNTSKQTKYFILTSLNINSRYILFISLNF